MLTIDELATLRNAAEQPHLQAFIITMMATVARPGTVLDLTRVQCDLEHGLIDLNPPGRERTKKRRPVVRLVPSLRPWVQAAEGPLVSWRGDPVKKVAKSWRALRKAAGLSDDVVPYTIRHTMATEMAERNVPELQINLMLGHRMPNSRTTDRYWTRRPGFLIEAAEAVEAVIQEMAQAAQRPIQPSNPVRGGCVSAPRLPVPGNVWKTGAGDEIRTHDPNLGKAVAASDFCIIFNWLRRRPPQPCQDLANDAVHHDPHRRQE